MPDPQYTNRQHNSWGRYFQAGLVALFFPLAVFAEPTSPIYSITDFVTCESAKMNAPHDWLVPGTAFRTTADGFFAWVELREVSGTHPVEMKLYRPDGTYYGQETQTINETNGIARWWRMVAWWRIKGENIAQMPGNWRLDLVIEGSLQRSISFNISPGTPGPVVASPSGFADSTTPAQVLANSPGRLWVVQASLDLLHWTNIQTNALPGSGYRELTGAAQSFRLTLDGRGIRRCVLEVSTDSRSWFPIQTNDLPSGSSLDIDSTGLVRARFYRAAMQ